VNEAPEYVAALLGHLLDEYARVYWNVFQEECPLTSGGSYGVERSTDETVLTVPGLFARSYWWGDDADPRAEDANWEFDGVAFTWYKHPLRSLETNTQQSPTEWAAWFDRCAAAIRTADIW